MQEPFRCIIHGAAASKANSRRHVSGITKDGKPYKRSIKSDAALAWLQGAAYQVRPRPTDKLLTGTLSASLRLWYASERPDLDPSLVLDFLQGRAYANDRQVRALHVYHGIDKRDPRVEVLITEISDIEAHTAFMWAVHFANISATPIGQKRPKKATSTKAVAGVA